MNEDDSNGQCVHCAVSTLETPGERLRKKLDAMTPDERQKARRRLFNTIADMMEEDDGDEEWERVQALSSEELDAELREMGHDPEGVAARIMETVNRCIAKYKPT